MKPRDIQPFSTGNTCFLISLGVQQYLKSLGIPSRIIKHNMLGRERRHCEVVFYYEGQIRMYSTNEGTSNFEPENASLDMEAIEFCKRNFKFDGKKKNRWPLQATWLTPVVE